MNEQSNGNLWYRRGVSVGDGIFEVSSHLNALHDDGEMVNAQDEPSDANEIWRARVSDAGILRIDIDPAAVPDSPPVWYVYVPEPSANPAAVNLVAYLSDGSDPSGSKMPPAGTVISANRFPLLGVSNDAQVAAIRWYPRDGLIHQVYVRASARRQSLGTVMIYSASAFHQAHGWAGVLHGDGRRTDLGDKFVAGLRHPQRYAPLAETQPPMD